MKASEEDCGSFKRSKVDHVFDNQENKGEECVGYSGASLFDQIKDENFNTKPSIGETNIGSFSGDTSNDQVCINSVKQNSQTEDALSVQISFNNSSTQVVQNREEANFACHKEKNETESDGDVFLESKIEIENHHLLEYDQNKFSGNAPKEYGEQLNDIPISEANGNRDISLKYNEKLNEPLVSITDRTENAGLNVGAAKILSDIVLAMPLNDMNALPKHNFSFKIGLQPNVKCENKARLKVLNTREELIIFLEREDLLKLQMEHHQGQSKTKINTKSKWHRWRSNQSKKFWCRLCPFTSFDKFSFMVHTAEDHEEEAARRKILIQYIIPGEDPNTILYKCTDCDYKSEVKEVFNRHLITHKQLHEVECFRCDKCNFVTKTRHGLIKHVKVHEWGDRADVANCPYCSYQTVRKSYMAKHIKMIHKTDEVEMFECKMCGFKTKYTKSFESHLLTHDDSRPLYKCHLCSWQSLVKALLRKHMLKHADNKEEKIFHCAHCPYKTPEKNSLKRHCLTHRGPDEVEMVECGLCPYRTIHKSYIHRHREKHIIPDKNSMHPCSLCSYQGKSEFLLKTHMKIHTIPDDAKMHKCKECPYKSRTGGNMKRHSLTHKNPAELQWFQCDICDYKANSKDRLRTHIYVVHKDDENTRWYACDKCDYKTKALGNLKRHALCHVKKKKVGMTEMTK